MRALERRCCLEWVRACLYIVGSSFSCCELNSVGTL